MELNGTPGKEKLPDHGRQKLDRLQSLYSLNLEWQAALINSRFDN